MAKCIVCGCAVKNWATLGVATTVVVDMAAKNFPPGIANRKDALSCSIFSGGLVC